MDNLHYEKFADGTIKCIEDEIPFEVPESWGWERIRNIGTIIRGNGIKRSEIIEDGFPCVRYGEIYTTYNISFRTTNSFISEEVYGKSKRFSHGDILMTLTGENKPDIAKAVAYLGKQRVAASGDLAVWTAHGMYPLYLSYLLAAPYLIDQKIQQATGNIIVHISGEKIGGILITIPPLNEQKRIVQKVQELEIALEEYQEKEHILINLQCTFPDTLKKSVLQWAVQGKLVQQDENDEPATVLLERIRSEKEELIRQGKIKRDKRESVIYRGTDNSYYERFADGSEKCIDEEIPFEIPGSWLFVRLKEIGSIIGGGTPRTSNESYWDGNIYWITPADLSNHSDIYISHGSRSITELGLKDSSATLMPAHTVLYSSRAPIGHVAIAANALATNQGFKSVVPHDTRMSLFVYFCLKERTPSIVLRATGTTFKEISGTAMAETIVPLPPLREQKRICNKIRSLFTLLENMHQIID